MQDCIIGLTGLLAFTEGVNGLLPNLDLVNVVTYLCHSEKIKSGFHSRVRGPNQCMQITFIMPLPLLPQWEWLGRSQLLEPEHQQAVYTMVAMAAHQAPGLPLAGHAHFLQHRIDSLTVRGVPSIGATTTAAISRDLLGVAR